jgi:hypothetical protein
MSADPIATTVAFDDDKVKALRKWNQIACGVHGFSALLQVGAGLFGGDKFDWDAKVDRLRYNSYTEAFCKAFDEIYARDVPRTRMTYNPDDDSITVSDKDADSSAVKKVVYTTTSKGRSTPVLVTLACTSVGTVILEADAVRAIEGFDVHFTTGDATNTTEAFETYADPDVRLIRRLVFKHFGPDRKEMFKFPLAYGVASFSAICMLAHGTLLLLGSSLVPADKWYNYNNMILNKKINYVRWAEYTISSGLMLVNVAAVCRITDFYLLSTILVCTSITNVFGLWTEMAEGRMFKWVPFLLGFVPFALPWYIIIEQMITSSDFFEKNIKPIVEAKTGESFPVNIPVIFQVTAGVLFGIYFLFPANMAVQYWGDMKIPILKRSVWNVLGVKDEDAYYKGEIGYLMLSLVSKTFLSWMIFGGTLAGEGYGEKDRGPS